MSSVHDGEFNLNRLNVILREPEQILLLKACIDRLSKARGGVKITAIQAVLELAKFYLENADKLDPISDVMRSLLDQHEQMTAPHDEILPND